MKPRTLTRKLESSPQGAALLILAIGMVIRLLLLPIRWINPDEGAHLMDAQLLLNGFMPIADYGARQPIYVFVLAMFLKAFGASLQIGRLVPLLASLGTGWLLFVIGRRITNATVGLIAACIYMFLPLTIVWSVIVKEEPLAIFLTCVSVYYALCGFSDTKQKSVWLIVSGLFAALAYYARSSTLYLPLTVIGFAFLGQKDSITTAFFRILSFLLGYIVVCLVIFLVFASKMSWQDILFSQLNPLNLVWNRAMSVFGWLPAEYRVVDSAGFRLLDQSFSDTIKAWRESVLFSLFVIVGGIAAVARLKIESSKGARSKSHSGSVLMILWAGFALLLYIFQSANRGFFTQYFVEVLPPLTILAAVWLQHSLRLTTLRPTFFFTACLAGFFALFFLQRISWQIYPGVGAYLIFGSLVASIAMLVFISKIAWKPRGILLLTTPSLLAGVILLLERVFQLEQLAALVLTLFCLYLLVETIYEKGTKDEDVAVRVATIFVFIVAIVVSGLYSGHSIGPKYESVWSPVTVEQVAATLKKEAASNDEILSGATIWAFAANLRPFLNVPHPTEFFKKRMQGFEEQFRHKRPQFIIDDGYAHRKYARYWSFIRSELESNYYQVAKIPGSKYPVIVFRLTDNPQPNETFLTLQGGVIPFTPSSRMP